MNLIANFSKFGFDIGIVRFLPNGNNKIDMINSCLTVILILSIVFSLIFVVGIDIWSPALRILKENVFLFFSFMLFVIFSALVQTLYNIFVAFRKSEFSFIQNTTWFLLKLIFVVFLTSFGAIGIFISWGGSVFFGLLVSIVYLLPKICSDYIFKPIIKIPIIEDMFYFSFGNYIANMFAVAPQMVLPLLVVNVLGSEMTAYFFIAWSIANVLFMIPNAVGMSLFTEGSYRRDKLKENVFKSLKFTFLLLIPSIVVMVLFGDKILCIFGKEYSENACRLLQILAVSTILVTINTLYVGIKRVQMDIKAVIFIYAFTTILTLVLSYILMPKIGLIGVGIGWILSHGIICILVMVSYLKELYLKFKV